MLVAIHFLVFYFELCVRYGKGDRDSFMCLLPLKNSVGHVGRGLLGGKGGFGAMLRNAGKSGGGQVKNFGACRDLTGRRLRHVNGP